MATTVAFVEELLADRNGTFGGVGTPRLTPWTEFDPSTIATVTAIAHGGIEPPSGVPNGMLITYTSAVGANDFHVDNTFTAKTLVPGETYTLKFWAWGTGTGAGKTVDAKINTNLLAEYPMLPITPTGAAARYSVSFTAAPGETSISSVFFRTPGWTSGNTLRITDVMIYRTRLDLNSSSGFQLVMPGVTFEDLDVDREWFTQAPYDGAVSVGDHFGPRTLHIPIRMTTQASTTAMQVLMRSLSAELRRTTNAVLFQPHAWPDSYLAQTYRGKMVSLFRGEEAPSPPYLLQDPKAMVLTLPMAPGLRGAGSYV